MKHTVADIAKRVGGALEGDGSSVITGVAGVRDAVPGEIAFVSQARYAADVATTRATAILVAREWNSPAPAALIRVDNPEAAFTEVAKIFAPPPVMHDAGVHASAVVARDVQLGNGVCIGACCVVESGATIGARTILHAGCYIGHGATIGDDCIFYPHVSIREYVQVGNRVLIHDGSVVGSDGFGYTMDGQGVRHKIPQIGIVVVGDDVEIGANTTIDRARFGKTRIGKGVKIDNLVQIGHNVIIGDHAVIVAQVGISGSTIIGRHAMFGGQAGAAGHLTIGDGAIVAARGGVTKNIPAKAFVSGFPAAPHKKASELNAHLNRLPQLKEKVADMEQRLKKLEDR